jgi:hypothetical protein
MDFIFIQRETYGARVARVPVHTMRRENPHVTAALLDLVDRDIQAT